MNGFLAVLAREVDERRMVFLVAAALSLAPFAAPLLLARNGDPGSVATLATAMVLALALSGVLAAALGASVIAGELADRRLAFYFERPLSGWAIWGGKLGAALALALGAGTVVLLPAALLYGRQEPGLLPELLLAWPAGALLLLLVCHALGVIARARTAWILLDVVAALVVAGLAWFDAHALLRGDLSFTPQRLLPPAAAILGLALASAGAAQVIGGRTDMRRAHRLLSSTLWSGLLAAALAATVYVAWYVHPAPSALDMVAYVSGERSGRWVEMSGAARLGGGPEAPRFLLASFLVDRTTGSWLRMRPAGAWPAWRSSHFSPVMFAADGRSAAWLERAGDGSRNELVRVDLTTPHPTPRETRLTFGTPYLALSPDGARIAALEGNRVVVTEIATGRLLASIAAAVESTEQVFVGADRLRLFEAQQPIPGKRSGVLSVDELEVAGGRVHPLGRIQLDAPYTWSASPDAERLLIRTYPPGGNRASSLYDAASGRLLAVLAQTGHGWKQAEFLPDGQLVRIERSPAFEEISLLTRDGALAPGTRPYRRGPGSYVVVAGQASATELLAMESVPLAPKALRSRTARGSKGETAAVDRPVPFRLVRLDLARGAATELARGAAPRGDFLPRPLTARSPAFLARTAQGWTWIDAAGHRTPLVAGGG